MSEKEGVVELSGFIAEALPNSSFRIELDNGQEATAYVAGTMRRNRIRVLPGDKVTVQFSPYDLKLGRITRRLT